IGSQCSSFSRRRFIISQNCRPSSPRAISSSSAAVRLLYVCLRVWLRRGGRLDFSRWKRCDMNEPVVTSPPSIPQATTGDAFLEARDVHKFYTLGKRKLEVLQGVSLLVQRGDRLALRGA